MISGLKIENLDHLGLIAGVIDELGLVEILDGLFVVHPQNHISTGKVVKAMVLNCLGFLSAPLYLFSEFFESKPVEHLLGEGIEAHHLNDDRIGRVLDQLWEFGLSSLFVRLAMAAVSKFGISVEQTHLDSSSLSVQGEYLAEKKASKAVAVETNAERETSTEEGREKEVLNGDESEAVAIEVSRGYSRDHRPDLKQFVTNLCCARDGGVPLLLEVASGNQSDRQQFAHLMQKFRSQWNVDTLFVVDAAFYSKGNLQRAESLRWISRVPVTISEARTLIHQDTQELESVKCGLKDYKLWEIGSTYAEIEQRWILVESQTRKGQKSLCHKDLKKIETGLKQRVKKLQKQVFACRPDAIEALLQFQDSLQYHHLCEVAVEAICAKRPPGQKHLTKDTEAVEGYQLQFSWQCKPEAERLLTEKRSRFILATNQLDSGHYPAQSLLTEYKQQQKVERGFRFFKDPLFFTSSVFVKKTQRVAALAFLMAVTLLIYTLAERKIRHNLQRNGETVLDQRQHPTSSPTFRWILQKFQGIHFVVLDGIEHLHNLNDERVRIIRLLGPPACRYYLLS